MKIGLFSDSHYCKRTVSEAECTRQLSYKKIQEAMKDFKASEVELVICLGDLVDVGSKIEDCKKSMQELVAMIRSYGIPFLFVTGNHDFNVATIEEMEELIGIPVPPMIYDTEEYRFICLDANYDSNLKHFGPEGYDWTEATVPVEQLEYLRNALESAEKECIVAIHEPIDPRTVDMGQFGIWATTNNASEIREIIEKSEKVKLVLQGHLHQYYDVIENGIRYITVVGMCEGLANRYMIMDLNKLGSELCVKIKEGLKF